MDTPRRRFLPREGLYIDPIAIALRRTLFNSWLMGGLSILLRWKKATDNLQFLQPFLEDHRIQTFIGLLAIFGALLDGNDFLVTQFHNNWTKDESWDWDKEIVLITGGSSGIGASVAQQLLKKNKKTVIVILDYSPLSFVAPKGSRVHYYQCDLSKSSEIKTICARVRDELGDPTVIFNNAGLTGGYTVMEGSYADVEITFRTNVIAPFLIVKEFLPAMVRKNHGHIIATSSMSSIITPAGLADYAATKTGLNALHEGLAQELKYKHSAPKVRLSLATLGFVATPMFKGQTNQSAFITPLMHVDTIGEKIVDILYSGYGQNIYLPGTMRYVACVRGWPEWIGRAIANETNKLKVDYMGRQTVDPKTGNLS